MAKISFSIFIDSLHSELALRFCLYTTPYIFLYKLTQASPTHSCLISSLKLCFLSGFSLYLCRPYINCLSQSFFYFFSFSLLFSQDLCRPYINCLSQSFFFLSLYYFLGATSLDLIYILIFLLMLKGLLHTEAMELINGTISPHREELLGFLSRYHAVRSDKYLSYIQNLTSEQFDSNLGFLDAIGLEASLKESTRPNNLQKSLKDFPMGLMLDSLVF